MKIHCICFVTQHFLTQHSRHLFLEIKKPHSIQFWKEYHLNITGVFFLVMFVTLIKPFHGLIPTKTIDYMYYMYYISMFFAFYKLHNNISK